MLDDRNAITYGEVFEVEWSRGHKVHTTRFAGLDIPACALRYGDVRHIYPRESALRYADERRALGSAAKVYRVVNGIRHEEV